jgi:hypothetical protein
MLLPFCFDETPAPCQSPPLLTSKAGHNRRQFATSTKFSTINVADNLVSICHFAVTAACFFSDHAILCYPTTFTDFNEFSLSSILSALSAGVKTLHSSLALSVFLQFRLAPVQFLPVTQNAQNAENNEYTENTLSTVLRTSLFGQVRLQAYLLTISLDLFLLCGHGSSVLLPDSTVCF